MPENKKATRADRAAPTPAGPVAEAFLGVLEAVSGTLVPEIVAAAKVIVNEMDELKTDCPSEKARYLFVSTVLTGNLVRAMNCIGQVTDGAASLFNTAHVLRLFSEETRKGYTAEDALLTMKGNKGKNSEHPEMLGQLFRMNKAQQALRAATQDLDKALHLGTMPSRENVTLLDIEKFREWMREKKPELLDLPDTGEVPPFVPGPDELS